MVIPTVQEKTVMSLRKLFTYTLRDRHHWFTRKLQSVVLSTRSAATVYIANANVCMTFH